MGWWQWLVELLDLPQPPRYPPGTHDSHLEELRVSGLLRKERAKPAGQRDEALFWRLSVEANQLHLDNAKAYANRCAVIAARFEQPDTQRCCAAAGWVRQRVAASYRAQHGYYSRNAVQASEQLAAARARRPAVIAAEPMLPLELSGALQQQPPRMDMCSECARLLQQVELAEGSCRAWVEVKKRQFQELGTQTAAPADAAASSGTAAAAAAVGPVGEQQQQPSQQQQQQCSADSNAGGAEGGPVTPKQPQQQQQHTSSDQEQEQQQHPSSDQEQQLECDAADERRLLPSEMMQQPHVSPQ